VPNNMDKPILPITVPPEFRIIAHRGASAYAPENSLAAFRLAEKMGATEIEFDLQFSKDSQIMVCHDRVLDRYGYPGRRLADLTCEDLRKLDMGSWFSPFHFGGERMMTFNELLAEFGKNFTHHAEIKEPAPGLAEMVLETLTAHGVQDRTIVTSFHFDALVEVKVLAPGQRVGWLVREGGLNTENIERAADANFHQLCPMATDTSKDMVQAAQARLAEVRTHSVKGVATMIQAIEAGCTGMTINWPDWLVHEKTQTNHNTDEVGR
jgi:glycerophosphoryl diester phosphodiesterase